ncbi:hypothetical protein A4G20_08405 [Pasteurellaceae bacterium RH1A]|nr:hypothetical protein A4G20_08405 [Pasteurellaceae bacterium RH1A]
MENTSQILQNLSQKNQLWQKEEELIEAYQANYFNIFHFIPTNEVGLSYILKFLLNPKESHGQKIYFLIAF